MKEFRVGDDGIELVLQVRESGRVRDLTGYGDFQITVTKPDNIPTTKPATLKQLPTDGLVFIVLAAADIDQPGNYDARVSMAPQGGGALFISTAWPFVGRDPNA